MADITAAMVKELREMTGAGMMDCKKALNETDGNMDEAVEVLRKMGVAKTEKKAGRIAAEGICRVALDGNKKAAVVEVNSETDFVAKNETFQTFVEAVAKQALASSAADAEGMMDEPWIEDSSKTVKDMLVEKTATIGEKLSIRRFARVEGEVVVSYIHGGGKIGVLVAGTGNSEDEATREALTNVAMQIAAMNPKHVSKDNMTQEELDKLKEIVVCSSLNEPATLPMPILNKLIGKAVSEKLWSEEDISVYEEKKSNMKFLFNFLSAEANATLIGLANDDRANIEGDKIFSGLVDGRVKKELKEICLMDQPYVRAEDGKQTVAQYLEQVSKAAGTAVSVKKFIRFETGEGIEKKNEDFAAEVAAQMNA